MREFKIEEVNVEKKIDELRRIVEKKIDELRKEEGFEDLVNYYIHLQDWTKKISDNI